MVHQAPSFGSDSDWMEPSVQLCHSRVLQPHAYDQVYNAFDLLRTEPSVQVIFFFLFLDSLSSKFSLVLLRILESYKKKKIKRTLL